MKITKKIGQQNANFRTLESVNIIRQTRRAEPMITYQNGRKQARVN